MYIHFVKTYHKMILDTPLVVEGEKIQKGQKTMAYTCFHNIRRTLITMLRIDSSQVIPQSQGKHKLDINYLVNYVRL